MLCVSVKTNQSPPARFLQIQLKDLLRTGNVKTTVLKGNSLMELMKLKPPPDIAPPVATAAAVASPGICYCRILRLCFRESPFHKPASPAGQELSSFLFVVQQYMKY